MTLKAMAADETVVKRWSRSLPRGGGRLALVSGPKGLRLLKQDIMADDARAYKEISIRVGERMNGGPIYGTRVTAEMAELHAEANGFEVA